jgi:hypothetical protein
MFGILSQSVGMSSCSSESCIEARMKASPLRPTRSDERELIPTGGTV